jgi:hypothetical protein
VTFPNDMTISAARAWLRGELEHGAPCPCCTQMAKIYRRKVNATMARALIALYRAGGTTRYIHAPSLPGDTHEMSQLAWWGLIAEESDRIRDDGGRAGWWRVTELGERWLYGAVTIPKYARIYDHRLLKVDGDPTTLEDALRRPFNLRELMDGI